MNTQTVPSHCYIGRKPCGCAINLCVDNPDEPKHTARLVKRMKSDGLTVERVPIDDGRNLFVAECPHKRAKR